MPRFDKDSFPSSGSYYQETCYARPYAREQEEVSEPTPEEVEAARVARLIERQQEAASSCCLSFTYRGWDWYVQTSGTPTILGFFPDQTQDSLLVFVPYGWMEKAPYDWRGEEFINEWMEAAAILIDKELSQ